MGEYHTGFALVGIACLSPLTAASWLLRRRVQGEVASDRQKRLKLGTSLGFVSCASVVAVFILFLFWDPAGAGSDEAPNRLLSFLALAGNVGNVIALVVCASGWSRLALRAMALLVTNQVLWLFMGALIVTAHGF